MEGGCVELTTLGTGVLSLIGLAASAGSVPLDQQPTAVNDIDHCMALARSEGILSSDCDGDGQIDYLDLSPYLDDRANQDGDYLINAFDLSPYSAGDQVPNLQGFIDAVDKCIWITDSFPQYRETADCDGDGWLDTVDISPYSVPWQLLAAVLFTSPSTTLLPSPNVPPQPQPAPIDPNIVDLQVQIVETQVEAGVDFIDGSQPLYDTGEYDPYANDHDNDGQFDQFDPRDNDPLITSGNDPLDPRNSE